MDRGLYPYIPPPTQTTSGTSSLSLSPSAPAGQGRTVKRSRTSPDDSTAGSSSTRRKQQAGMESHHPYLQPQAHSNSNSNSNSSYLTSPPLIPAPSPSLHSSATLHHSPTASSPGLQVSPALSWLDSYSPPPWVSRRDRPSTQAHPLSPPSSGDSLALVVA